jgi:signal peptidase I
VIVVPRGSNEDYIKRVVALPGDRIAVVHGQIILNGKPVPQVVEPPLDLRVDANEPCETGDFPACAFATRPATISANCRSFARPCPMAQPIA